MEKLNVVQDDDEGDTGLSAMGLNKPDLIKVVQESVLAHNNSTSHDPANAAGWQAYCSGTRALRDIFCPQGWKLDRKDSVESIVNEDESIKIVYQNVDCAADHLREPKARSKKGAGSERAVAKNQLRLFSDEELGVTSSNGIATWYLCVAIRSSGVHAELSLPESLDGGQFSGFIKRIFILKGGEFSEFPLSNFDTDIGPDFDVNVSRK